MAYDNHMKLSLWVGFSSYIAVLCRMSRMIGEPCLRGLDGYLYKLVAFGLVTLVNLISLMISWLYKKVPLFTTQPSSIL